MNTKVAGMLLLVLLFFLAPSVTQALSRGFDTEDTDLRPGMVAAIAQNASADSTKVERASYDNADKVIGIVTTSDDSGLTVSSAARQVLVETSGEVDAYVSDLNGEVQSGELVQISPLKGILMKSSSSGVVIGVALESSNDAVDSFTVNLDGSNKDAKVTKVKISLDRKSVITGQQTDSSLESLGESVVGKEVSEIRVALAMVIFTMVLIAEGGIIYGAVSSAITSLGRNPLAKGVIRAESFRVLIVSVTVLMIGLAAVYIILWL